MRSVLLLLAAVLLYPSSSFATANPVEHCLAKDKRWSVELHKKMMAEQTFECAAVYYKLNAKQNKRAPYGLIKSYLDDGYKVIMVLIIDAKKGVNPLIETLRGGNDNELFDLFYEMRKDFNDREIGELLSVRLWHETDGDWYKWQIYYPLNSVPLVVEGFQYLHRKFKSAGLLPFVSLESNFNRKDALSWKPITEAKDYMPQIDAVVEAHSGSSYNRCGSSDSHTKEKSFASEYGPFYDRIIQFTDKPVNIAEVSTTGLCAEKMPWFREMLRVVREDYTRVETITFVQGTIPVGEASNNVEIPWGFSTNAERAAFADLLNEDLRLRGMPEVMPKTLHEKPKGLDFSLGFDSAPWSLWTRFTYPFEEIDNTALNSTSGEPFGETGPLLRTVFKQRWLTYGDKGRRLRFGPGIQLGYVWSDNKQMWWNNQNTIGVSFGAYWSARRGKYVSWGNTSLELLYTSTHYLTDEIPDRLTDDPKFIGIQLETVFGGDHARNQR